MGPCPNRLRKKAWDKRRSTRSNLRALAFDPGGILLEDAWVILHEELGEAAGYQRVLAAIGSGRTRLSQIESEAGGGQGAAVIARRLGTIEVHVGRVFQEQARAHAVRLVDEGRLPADLVVGRWWTTAGEPCEIVVVGLRGPCAYLLGEARWQRRPLGLNVLAALIAKGARLPEVAEEPLYTLWGRHGVVDGVKAAGALGFSAEDLVEA